MAKMYLKPGAKPEKIAKRLKKQGIIVKRKLPDGSYVIYKKRGERLTNERVNELGGKKPNPSNVLRTATGSPIGQSPSPLKGRDVMKATRH